MLTTITGTQINWIFIKPVELSVSYTANQQQVVEQQ